MKVFRWPFICVVLVLAYAACACFYGPAKGWFYRTFRTPAILHSTFIVDFDKQQATAQRQKFIDIYQTKSGSYGLHKAGSNFEGQSVGGYLIVTNGRVSLVSDFTRDAYSIRSFLIRYPTNVVLGTISPSEEADPVTPPQGSIVLKCYLDSGGALYF